MVLTQHEALGRGGLGGLLLLLLLSCMWCWLGLLICACARIKDMDYTYICSSVKRCMHIITHRAVSAACAFCVTSI